MPAVQNLYILISSLSSYFIFFHNIQLLFKWNTLCGLIFHHDRVILLHVDHVSLGFALEYLLEYLHWKPGFPCIGFVWPGFSSWESQGWLL